MPCLSSEELAILYDGVIQTAKAQQLREHVSSCARCANEFRQLDRFMSVRKSRKPSASLLKKARDLGQDTTVSNQPHKRC